MCSNIDFLYYRIKCAAIQHGLLQLLSSPSPQPQSTTPIYIYSTKRHLWSSNASEFVACDIPHWYGIAPSLLFSLFHLLGLRHPITLSKTYGNYHLIRSWYCPVIGMVALHPADGNQSTICNHLYRLYIVQVQMENLACMGDKHACGGHAVDSDDI